MKKNMLAALALCLMLPCAALGEIVMTELADAQSGSVLVDFEAKSDLPEGASGKETPADAATMGVNMQIAVRFEQEAARKAMGRGSVLQQGRLWQDGKIASMARTWRGEQTNGREGSAAAALTVNLETGMEIYLDELFTDPQSAIEAMETILSDDVLDGMSDYMEYSDLLPMPTDSYSVDQSGLTVYWPEDRYRYFDGTAGSVTFYWYELADYIGEDSPVYALAHPQTANNSNEVESIVVSRTLSGEVPVGTGTGLPAAHMPISLGDLLGGAKQWTPLADPDYTTDALVYPLERVRGYSVEIPKYAETDEDETPISAIRASRISLGGLLTTGKTTEMEILQLMGEPAETIDYDEDAAFDAMLEPGTSFVYWDVKDRVLQLHVDEQGVLSCVILRDLTAQSGR